MAFLGKQKLSDKRGGIIKEKRVMWSLTVRDLAAASDVSASHIVRI